MAGGSLLVGIVLLAAASGSARAADVIVFETNIGAFEVTLRPDAAPKTVAHIESLVTEGFYDGLVFHRIEPGFVIQAGGYDASGNYREPPGTVVNESVGGLPNTITSVAMARRGDPDSADAQFYINLRNNPHLDALRQRPGYTVFGYVTRGWQVVESIAAAELREDSSMPVTPIVIEHARLRRAQAVAPP